MGETDLSNLLKNTIGFSYNKTRRLRSVIAKLGG